jgi:hypothetical protein
MAEFCSDPNCACRKAVGCGLAFEDAPDDELDDYKTMCFVMLHEVIRKCPHESARLNAARDLRGSVWASEWRRSSDVYRKYYEDAVALLEPGGKKR